MYGGWPLVGHGRLLVIGRSPVVARIESLDSSKAEKVCNTISLDLLIKWRVTAESRRQIDLK